MINNLAEDYWPDQAGQADKLSEAAFLDMKKYDVCGSVMKVESDTFGDPFFQNSLQN